MKQVGFAILLLVAGAAVWLFYDSDHNVIDEDSLKTEAYRSMNRNGEERLEIAGDTEHFLVSMMQEMLSNVKERHLSLPVRLDSLSVEELLNEDFRIRMQQPVAETSASILSNRDYYLLDHYRYNGMQAILFVAERPGVYKDVDMYLATLKDSSLADMQLILEYRKNLAEKISGEAYFGDNRKQVIRAFIWKKRFYPVEQADTVAYSYTIHTDGTIDTKIDSVN